ncbi:threonine--tRNA ligase [Borreliella burgdorferi]|uniref:Threonine--tRNA ligase n=1 Tax=Borreliella burgdorferi 118a TaxID=476210 RepID=A0A7U8I4R2_BORBG|nr:threonine--tRNA ligase [Borreliella burgdorferi]EEE18492.1 threonyl-tRNA synthetase [Borreliella burgdorferi 72a]EEF83869.1 threonyl-tRNA synthetase [Borreliella burgdorferi CA-11.2A]EEG98884.1 threonyl-tRNA synthetase [Borreliella burgdorferi 118a]MCD2375074.1 threonine--tRNA ligase [Borreliella burgdorferi]MCD2387204.1 threonine--tRNA ligase [Borreliella burgdorferi]
MSKDLDKEDILYKKRHSIAHVMAEAVLDLFPNTKIAIGPPIKDGFYYDFEFKKQITEDSLLDIENRMREILKTGSSFEKEIISVEQALEIFKDEPYKIDLIKNFDLQNEVSIYKSHNFVDLCRGPHVENMNKIDPKAFKLTSIAGAYWRGSEKNPMLTRIYGTLWNNEKELRSYLNLREEIKKRDHRKLGKELDLFSIHEEIGPGLVFFHPNGAKIRALIEDFWREEHSKNGYDILFTPHIGKSWLWQTSGHLDFYKDSMFEKIEMDKSDYYLKPMNCPFHIAIYNTGKHSYRDLPFRWAELGTVYRYEKIGALHGMMRARGFTQDDAHIICTHSQVLDEIKEVLRFAIYMWSKFGFSNPKAYLSTKPDKSVGNDSDWEMSLKVLEETLSDFEVPYEIDKGGGAFYGPKIDLKIVDSLEREWQMSTIQFDFNLPERFNMTYTAEDGKEKRPFMIHRALLGSIERFFGILVEHYGGAFPLWLSPVQVVIIPVNNIVEDYAIKVFNKFKNEGIRIKLDNSSSRMNAKIREYQAKKIPYMFIIGEREAIEERISIRTRTNEQINGMKLDEALKFILFKIRDKEI